MVRAAAKNHPSVAVVVDPQRDIDRVLALAEEAGVSINHIFETHIHNDYLTGGLALAEATGAAYHVNAADEVSFERTPISDGDLVEVSPTMRVRALATPGHTFTHLSYALEALSPSSPDADGGFGAPGVCVAAGREPPVGEEQERGVHRAQKRK